MSLAKQFLKRFEAFKTGGLASAAVAGERRDAHMITETDGKSTIALELLDFDKYSYVIRSMEVVMERAAREAEIRNVLQKQARQLVEKVDYLAEAFALIELDTVNLTAQIRSAKPVITGKGLEFFEVILARGKRCTLRRCRSETGEYLVEARPFVMTAEIFSRLVGDLIFIMA